MSENLGSRLALIIPVYNESSAIRDTVLAVTVFVQNFHANAKIYFVDDGSTDETLDILFNSVTSESAIVKLEKNYGYGEALRRGALIAYKDGYEYCVFLDSDLTNPLSDIPRLIAPLSENDMVKASRYIEGASDSQVNCKRKVVSRIANLLFRILFKTKIKDISNGFRAWKLAEYVKIPGVSHGFDSIIEEFYYARIKHLKIAEAPTNLGSRNNSQRPTMASYSFQAIISYLRWPIKYYLESLMRKV